MAEAQQFASYASPRELKFTVNTLNSSYLQHVQPKNEAVCIYIYIYIYIYTYINPILPPYTIVVSIPFFHYPHITSTSTYIRRLTCPNPFSLQTEVLLIQKAMCHYTLL